MELFIHIESPICWQGEVQIQERLHRSRDCLLLRGAMALVFPWILVVLFHFGAAVVPRELHDDVLTDITPASTDIEADWAQD